jgi:hypothetical protein
MPLIREKPNIPPESCEHVDRILELVTTLSTEKNEEISERYIDIIEQELEMIRLINIQLRYASKFWYDKRKRKR